MEGGTGPHVTLFLPPQVAEPLDRIRQIFDPAYARQIGVHATLTYPEEGPDVGLLASRIGELAEWSGPIPLGLGAIAPYGDPPDPRRGLHVEVTDVGGAYLGARAHLLAPPFTMHPVEAAWPHVTLVHPRTSWRGPEAWDKLAGRRLDVEVMVERVALVAWDGATWLASKQETLTGTPW